MSSITAKPTRDVDIGLAAQATIEKHGNRTFWNFEQLATAAEKLGDAIAVVLGVWGAYALYHFLNLGRRINYSIASVLITAFLFAVLYILMLERDGAYRHGNSLLRIKETERVLRVSVQAFLIILPVSYFAAHIVSRWVTVLAFFLVPGAVITQKQLFFIFLRALHVRGIGLQRVLIYGSGFTGKRVFSALVRSPKLGLEPVAIIDDDEQKAGEEIYAFDYRRERCVRVTTGPLDADTIQSFDADMVVCGIPALGREKFAALVRATLQTGAKLAFVPSRSIDTDLWVNYADIDGIMLSFLGAPGHGLLYEILKRTFDVLTCLTILILTAPLLAIIAVAVRLGSEGPILFRQQRVGKAGKVFQILKFRSMRVDVPKYGFSPTESDDPRITRVGRFLRKTSLDELPQLFNVLSGDMSLVGPRPEMPFIVEQYGSRERQRLCVLPGITGVWQLSADRAFLIHENVQYDLYYIRNRGFFMDLAILLHTAIFAMKGV